MVYPAMVPPPPPTHYPLSIINYSTLCKESSIQYTKYSVENMMEMQMKYGDNGGPDR